MKKKKPLSAFEIYRSIRKLTPPPPKRHEDKTKYNRKKKNEKDN
jgi:hypothetical protein